MTPYSIAIIINKLFPDLKDWNITILATDFNSCSLQKAFKGIYSEWSFRDKPAEYAEYKERYFKKTKEDQYAILSHNSDL
ncbi:MAG: CheR family methyltransferase [Nitrospirota bacterium]